MTAVLAATYHPRGEIERLRRLLPELKAVYSAIVISLPPTAQPADVAAIQALPEVQAFVNDDWTHGRYSALKAALEFQPDAVQYADFDRLLRWAETRPEEWRGTVAQIGQADCLVIGRTAAAWDTHPRAMFETEAIINHTFSSLLGQEMDFGAGSKGFSRRAVEFLMANTQPGHALGADTEWPVLLHRGGFSVAGILVDGLDWETADRHQSQAADAQRQRELAAAYDTNASHWAQRVDVAQEIIWAGFDALRRPLIGGNLRYIELRRHTMRLKPGQNLSQAGVELARQVGATTGPFNRVITSTVPRAYETAVAMGFAVDEQLEALSTIGDSVEAEVHWDAGFAGWAEAARREGAASRFIQRQAEFIKSVAAALPPGGAALIISHGGIVEAQAVGCLSDADHAAWGRACSWCEGVRLSFDGDKFVDAKILRVGDGE